LPIFAKLPGFGKNSTAGAVFAGEVGLDDDAESIQSDATIDTNEVMTEQEYIRLLTLYQPVAID